MLMSSGHFNVPTFVTRYRIAVADVLCYPEVGIYISVWILHGSSRHGALTQYCFNGSLAKYCANV